MVLGSMQMCFGCAYQLASRGLAVPICPFCRGKIADFASAQLSRGAGDVESDVNGLGMAAIQ